MKRRLCFTVNPFAGLGGPLARKGTDASLIREAVARGYRLISVERASLFAEELARHVERKDLLVYTAAGLMGAEVLRKAGVDFAAIYSYTRWPTDRVDTINTVRRCAKKGAELVVFVGGDGTARDVVEALEIEGLEEQVPVIGVPAGVKMFSSVFAQTPQAAALAVAEWIGGRATTCRGVIADYDEESYRRGVLRPVFYASVHTLCLPYIVGSTKSSYIDSDVEDNRAAIARYFVENYVENCTLYVLGPGSTVSKIAEAMGVGKTLLGVDVVHNGKLVGRDVNEEALYRLVSEHVEKGGRVKIVLSPIGGQGFILGRGNQQISPRILRLVGREAIVVVADRRKINELKGRLRIDTGDPELDRELKGYYRVIVDYGEEYVAKAE